MPIPSPNSLWKIVYPFKTPNGKYYKGDYLKLLMPTEEAPFGIKSGICNWHVKCKFVDDSVWSMIWAMADKKHITQVETCYCGDTDIAAYGPECTNTHCKLPAPQKKHNAVKDPVEVPKVQLAEEMAPKKLHPLAEKLIAKEQNRLEAIKTAVELICNMKSDADFESILELFEAALEPIMEMDVDDYGNEHAPDSYYKDLDLLENLWFEMYPTGVIPVEPKSESTISDSELKAFELEIETDKLVAKAKDHGTYMPSFAEWSADQEFPEEHKHINYLDKTNKMKEIMLGHLFDIEEEEELEEVDLLDDDISFWGE